MACAISQDRNRVTLQVIQGRKRRNRRARIAKAAVNKKRINRRSAEIKVFHNLDISHSLSVDRALNNHVKLIVAGVGWKRRYAFHNGLASIELAADNMLVPSDNSLFSPICQTQ